MADGNGDRTVDPEELAVRVKATKAKYGSLHWWEPGFDPLEMAWYQLNEPVLLVDFGRFQLALDRLLGRPVWVHELAVCLEELRAEAARVRAGNPLTDEEKAAAIMLGLRRLMERTEGRGS
jgi:hypothetical protein